MYILLGILFIISFIAAVRSMKDFEVPEQVKQMLNSKQVKGSIVFFKNKIMHYSSEYHSSDSSSSSSRSIE